MQFHFKEALWRELRISVSTSLVSPELGLWNAQRLVTSRLSFTFAKLITQKRATTTRRTIVHHASSHPHLDASPICLAASRAGRPQRVNRIPQ